MTDAEKIHEIKRRLGDQKEIAESIRVLDRFSGQILGMAREDAKQTVHGEQHENPAIDLTQAKAALRTIHDGGEQVGIQVPFYEDDKEFLKWLMDSYFRSMLF